MGKYFCTDCGQRVDDVVCPICGNLAEDLRFDEGSPDGRSDRYDDSVVVRVGETDEEIDPELLPDLDEAGADDDER